MKRTNDVSPCKGCNDRTEFGACHDTCEKYIEWKKKIAECTSAAVSRASKTRDADAFIFKRVSRRNKA